jgi:hypothetical protein
VIQKQIFICSEALSDISQKKQLSSYLHSQLKVEKMKIGLKKYLNILIKIKNQPARIVRMENNNHNFNRVLFLDEEKVNF